MALWSNPDKKSGLQRVATLDFGGGVNNGVTPPHLIADNESPLMLNIAPYMLPVLTPCYPAVAQNAYPGPILMVADYKGQFAVMSGGKFYYNNAQQGSQAFLGTSFSFCSFMGGFYFSSALDGLYVFTNSGAPTQVAAATAPLGAYITANANRLWITGTPNDPNMFQGCDWRNTGNWLATGDLGQYQNWIEAPSGEPNNGIASLTTGTMVVFKWTSYHEIWGDGPASDYTIIDRFYGVGCASNATIAEIGGYLYWLGVDGIYRWNGGDPERISDSIKNYLPNVIINSPLPYVSACADSRFYYISLGENLIFAYDTWNNNWWGPWKQYADVKANVMYRDAASTLKGVYIGDNSGIVYQIDKATNSNTLSWIFETKPYSDGSLAQEKQLVDAYLTAEVWPGASLQVYLSNRERDLNDGLDWTLIGSASAQTLPQTSKIFVSPGVLAPSYLYRLKFAGVGRVDIYGLDKDVYVTPKF